MATRAGRPSPPQRPVSQWGGPNADNVYRHARIDPAKRYVVRRMHSCEEFILALRAGLMHNETWGTLATITSELGIGAGDDFEFVLGDGGREIPDEAIMASSRNTTSTGRPRSRRPSRSSARSRTVELPPLDDRLHAAVDQVSDSLRYWAHYLPRTGRAADNSFASTVALPAKG